MPGPVLVRHAALRTRVARRYRVREASSSRGAPLKHCASPADKGSMISDLLGQGVPVAMMAGLIVSLWIVGVWTLVKDEHGPAVLFTRLLLAGFVVFLAWRFAVPLLR